MRVTAPAARAAQYIQETKAEGEFVLGHPCLEAEVGTVPGDDSKNTPCFAGAGSTGGWQHGSSLKGKEMGMALGFGDGAIIYIILNHLKIPKQASQTVRWVGMAT